MHVVCEVAAAGKSILSMPGQLTAGWRWARRWPGIRT